MATASLSISSVPSALTQSWVASWTLANSDSGAPFQNPGSPDRTVQVTGTFGAGGTIVIEGSNDGSNYSTLTDASGTNLSFTAASLKQITENVRYIRPRVSAGDGTTSLVVTILASGSFRG